MNNYYPTIAGSANPIFWDGECQPWLDAGKVGFAGSQRGTKEWREVLRPEAMREYNNTCANCGVQKRLPLMHCDHVMTKHEGGGNYQPNLQLLCNSCNCSKREVSLPKLQPWVGEPNEDKGVRCMELREDLKAHCKQMRIEIKAKWFKGST